MTPQVDMSDSQTGKRPSFLEHPAPLKQRKQSEEDNSILKTSTTDAPLITHTLMDMTVQGMLHSDQQRALMSKCTEFLNVKRQLKHLLQSYETKAMLEMCEKLMASGTNNIFLFSSVQLQKLRECKKAPEIIETLSPYFNWSTHSVLHAVINACNNSDASKLLDKFDSQIDSSLPVTDFPIPQPSPNMIPYNTSSHTVFAVKLSTEPRNCSLQQVFDVQLLLQELLQLSPHVFQLLAANSTPILYWMIPKCVVSVLTSNITQQRSYLYQNGVMELSIYPGSNFTTANMMRVGLLSFLNHQSDTEVKNDY